MAEYLKKYGPAVLENGYEIVSIRPGSKRPFGKNWQQVTFGPKTLAKAVSAGRSGFGVGIKTRLTPGVDIDCYDPDIVDHMIAFATERLGEGLVRVGQAPKTLLLYRAEKPFTKVQSSTYIDDEGRRVKLEVLGDGQQFVAFHIHPDTKKPFRWSDKLAPHVVPVKDLSTIAETDAQAFADEFDRLAKDKGWKLATKDRQIARRDGAVYDDDDPFIDAKMKVNVSPEELRAKLQMIPDVNDHDTWFQIGMALYHQFDGSEEGLMLWHEWSVQGNTYDQEALDYRWTTFNVQGKGREPLTARYILKLAQEEEQRVAGEELQEVRQALEDADSIPGVREVMDRIKHVAFDQLTREGLVADIRKSLKRINGTTMTAATIKKLIRYENPDHKNMPPWLANFVYVQVDETFFNPANGAKMSRRAFDASYGRFMMTKRDLLEGNTEPEHSASQVALNRYQIPTVQNHMYLPGEELFFSIKGLDYVNSYSDRDVPDEPEKYTKGARRAIQLVEDHLVHLFMHERDRKLLLDFMSWVARGGRVNWAPVIQGTEGDGKTFFFELMGAVLGASNVNTVPGEALADKNTSWAEGHQFLFIEEIRLHGSNRFAVLNKVKPYITNTMASVRRMQVDWYKVVNTVSYMLATNHKDGMPIDKKDTRYFPMFSRYQTTEAIAAFERQNPKYYDQLYGALEEHAGALRKWLIERELSPGFNAKKRAPVSAAKAEMIFLNQSEEDEAFEASLEDEEIFYSRKLLCSDLVNDKMSEHGSAAPYGRLLKQMLSEAGFTYLGRFTIGGEKMRLWSMTPSHFMDSQNQVTKASIESQLRRDSKDPNDIDI